MADMDDDDDDMYAPPEPVSTAPAQTSTHADQPTNQKREDTNSDMDEDDEEDDSESDIEIVTDAKDAKPPPTASTAKPTAALKITQPGREGSGTPQPKIEPGLIQPPKAEGSTPQPPTHDGKPGSAYPAYASSTLDIDAKPIYEPVGKPVTEIDMDADLAEDAKPWRLPGTDPADFFNYGFDEFTWATYCIKQKSTRAENQAEKQQMDQMQKFFGGGGPPMPPMMNMGMPIPPQQMSGMGNMPPEMMAALNQIIASGIDPSTLDLNTFTKMMGGGGTPLPENAGVPTGPAQSSGAGQAGGFAPPSGPKAQRGKGRW